jgi:hypothetical protein
MRFILSSHPNLAFSRRTNMWTRFYERYGDLAHSENFERCLSALLQCKHVRVLNPDPARIRHEFWQGEPTYARLFALLHEHYTQQQDKARWGDQSAWLEGCAGVVLSAYPEAKMIQMVRDPRDRYEATLTRSPNGKGRVGGVTATWLYSIYLAERNRQRYPERYKVVRFESLVSQPEKTVAEVCAFLDEEYFPEMLLMKGVPRFQKYSAEGRSPLSTEFIGRFQGRMPEHEIRFMQLLAGRKMRAYGYELHPVHFSLADWLSFSLVELPANLLRALVWRQWATTHDRAA